MAPKKQLDKAKAKAQRDKKIAIGGAVLLVLVLAFEVPKTMKMLSGPKTPVAAPTTTASATTPSPATPSSIAAPTLAGTAAPVTTTTSTDLVSAVPVSADSGQLQSFERFATKDPFAVQATTGTSSGGAKSGAPGGTSRPGPGSSGSGSAPKAPPAPPTPPPTSAVISVNGTPTAVSPGGDFPASAPVFHLVSLTQTTAKVSIAGGSYASGAQTLTLRVGEEVTLRNTADGSTYRLKLEPQGTPVPTSTAPTATTPTATTPTTTTAPSVPVVPSGGGG